MSLAAEEWPQGFLMECKHSFLCNCFYGTIIRLCGTLEENWRWSQRVLREAEHNRSRWEFTQSLTHCYERGTNKEQLLLTPFSFQHQFIPSGRKMLQKHLKRLGNSICMAVNQFGLLQHSARLFPRGIWTIGPVVFWLTCHFEPDVKYYDYCPNLPANLIANRWYCQKVGAPLDSFLSDKGDRTTPKHAVK